MEARVELLVVGERGQVREEGLQLQRRRRCRGRRRRWHWAGLDRMMSVGLWDDGRLHFI